MGIAEDIVKDVEIVKDEYGKRVAGLFGSTKYKPMYTVYVPYSKVSDRYERMAKNEAENETERIRSYLLPRFCSEVRTEADKRLDTMRKQVYDYLAFQDNAARKPYQAACDYLDELEKELK